MQHLLNKCRWWCENIAREEGFRQDLCGLCAVGAGRVYHRLKAAGHAAVICYNTNHCFNKVTMPEGDLLVDVTASQFNYPEIFVTEWKPADWYYQVDREFTNLRRFCRHLRTEGWTSNQIYDHYVTLK